MTDQDHVAAIDAALATLESVLVAAADDGLHTTITVERRTAEGASSDYAYPVVRVVRQLN